MENCKKKILNFDGYNTWWEKEYLCQFENSILDATKVLCKDTDLFKFYWITNSLTHVSETEIY